MSESEWKNGEGPHLRKIFGDLLREHVAYQDGRQSDAPSVLFADYDYEAGDGVCGIHPDGKQCGEPAIIYARADALVDALERAEKAAAERDALREGIFDALGRYQVTHIHAALRAALATQETPNN